MNQLSYNSKRSVCLVDTFYKSIKRSVLVTGLTVLVSLFQACGSESPVTTQMNTGDAGVTEMKRSDECYYLQSPPNLLSVCYEIPPASSPSEICETKEVEFKRENFGETWGDWFCYNQHVKTNKEEFYSSNSGAHPCEGDNFEPAHLGYISDIVVRLPVHGPLTRLTLTYTGKSNIDNNGFSCSCLFNGASVWVESASYPVSSRDLPLASGWLTANNITFPHEDVCEPVTVNYEGEQLIARGFNGIDAIPSAGVNIGCAGPLWLFIQGSFISIEELPGSSCGCNSFRNSPVFDWVSRLVVTNCYVPSPIE